MQHRFIVVFVAVACACASAACGNSKATTDGGGNGNGDTGPSGPDADLAVICGGVTCSGHGNCTAIDNAPACQCDGGYINGPAQTCVPSVAPVLAGCSVFPATNIFNTAIDTMPVDAHSAAYISTIGGGTKLHLDLGTETNQQADDFYGIPYNVVHGASMTWLTAAYKSTDPDLDWDPTTEADCANASHDLVSPCTGVAPILPIPASPIVEGGIVTATNEQPYGDHHILLLDADACRLWELYHAYSPVAAVWNIFGSAEFDLTSNALRPDGWTSADAAGFPILPLLLKADEASSGTIAHALRFTIESSSIRTAYIWPARHLTSNGTASTNLPPMGQAFRLKASYTIPSNYNTQAKAILTAMQTYGIYIADGGSSMYISGVGDAGWEDATFSQVQSVTANDFEAVDLTPIMQRTGFDPNSGQVP